MGLKVNVMQLDQLKTDPGNVRKHPDRNIAAIKASLSRFGQQHPIIVDSNNVVRVGNGRLAAMKQLGWTTCYAIQTDLPDEDLAAFAVADNRTSELATWDLDGLDVLLQDLTVKGISVEDIGFTEGDLASLLGPSSFEKAEAKGTGEAEEKEYTEKIVIVVSDMTKRAPITLAIKTILENNGWTESARVV